MIQCRGLFRLLMILLVASQKVSAQTSLKKVTVTVLDAVTQKAVEGAEVTYKGMIAKQRKKTDAAGKADFNIYIVASSVDVNFEIRNADPERPYKASALKFTLQMDKEYYNFTATLQPETSEVQFKITDEGQKPLANTKVKLKDAGGNELNAVTDAEGKVSFATVPAGLSTATLTVEKEGFDNYVIPLGNAEQGGVISVVATLQKKKDDGKSAGLLDPTGNVITTALPASWVSKYASAPPLWGPYTPACIYNPAADVPTYSSFFVADDKDLLDHIADACLGSAGEAVNSLTDLVLNIEALSSKMKAAWSAKNANAFAQSMKDSKKVIEDNQQELKKAAEDAIKKTSGMYENLQKLVEGPELFAVSCLWEGIVAWGVEQLPADLQELKKAADGIGKAKEAMEKKLENMKAWVASDDKLKTGDKMKIFTDWKDVTEGIQLSAQALGIMISYVKDPKKILPYEAQLKYALNTIDKMLNTLTVDCQVRKCDLVIRDGIDAGQQALTAARKYYAQMRKGELKWKEKLYQQTKNYDWEQLNFDPGIPGWDTWNKFREERVKAEEKTKDVEALLTKLGGYCERMYPISVTLNEKVQHYEELYAKALGAVEACKLEEANSYLKELTEPEQSDCGHFFPKPFGRTLSADLLEQINHAEQSGKCGYTKPGMYVLKTIEVNISNEYYKLSETTYRYQDKDGSNAIIFTLLNKPPSFIDPGAKFTLDFSASCGKFNAVLDYQTMMEWGSDKPLRYRFLSAGNVLVGNHEGRMIPTAEGTVTVTVPDDGGDQLILSVNIGAAGGATVDAWLKIIYAKK